MAENKTKASDASVAKFLDAVEPAHKREDARTVCRMMERLSGEPPVRWGPSIVGFGRYHYRYESGREGEMGRIGFSPRKDSLVLYLVGGFPRHQELMDRLGEYKAGKSCLYIRTLSDIDLGVLEELIAAALDYMREAYPES